jgi:hypothetical protein
MIFITNQAPSYDDFAVGQPAARHPLLADGELKLGLTSCDLLCDLGDLPIFFKINSQMFPTGQDLI